MLGASLAQGNLHHLTLIENIVKESVNERVPSVKLLRLPFYNFVCTLTEIMTDFSRSSAQTTFNMYIIDWHVRKYEIVTQLLRHLQGFLKDWKKYAQHHDQAKLYLSFLTPERNTREQAKIFLKIRKFILKNLNAKIMQQITITHQDSLALCHIQQFTEKQHTYTIKKINEFFINIKRKLVNSVKVNGAIICQFFLNCSETYHQQISQYQPKTNQSKQNIDPQDEYKYNSKNKNQLYSVSFSEEFADCYKKDHQHWKASPTVPIEYYQSQQPYQDSCLSDELQENPPNLNSYKNSIQYLKEKDFEMDQRRRNFEYPQGWQQFLQANKKVKDKLLKHVQMLG